MLNFNLNFKFMSVPIEIMIDTQNYLVALISVMRP